MKMILKGKRALVTGASVGIGRALARALASQGVTVVVAARRTAALDDLAAEIAAAGHPRPRPLGVDLGKRGAAADLAARATAEVGQIDILVNNAGANVLGSQFGAGDSDAMRELFELNYWSPLALIQALVPGMRQRRDGAVVNVTSLAGIAPWVFTGHYSSTKAALSLASETLRLELRGSGVHVLELMAGPTETALLAGARQNVPGAGRAMALGPTGTTEELARLVVRALERRRKILVYPRTLGLTPVFPSPSRWFMTLLQRKLDGDVSRLAQPGDRG
ncbi:MAG TPA: SDR family NAD(P)-dependent oxidoreductase [Candidatus Bathyarchaeia archaeon]|nr:SDR family NAD(P)-dependent oxidoreductase [Candidatus Bathyarchaeia archaeon]